MDVQKTYRRYFYFFIILAALIFAVTYLSLVPEIRETVGDWAVHYGYFGLFIFAFIGGTSTILPLPYILATFTLAGLGLHPIFLGIVAGTGVTLGDSISYLLGRAGHHILKPQYDKKFHDLSQWLNRHPYLTPAVLFFYGAFVPLPNDLLIVPLGLARYNYFKAIIPAWLGNVFFNFYIAYFGSVFL